VDKHIEDEVKMIDAHVQGEPEEEIYHVYNVPGGVVILRQGEVPEDQTATVIDSLPQTEPETHIPTTPLPTKQRSEPVTTAFIGVLLLAILIPLFCIAVQAYYIFNPFTVTVTLLERSQQVTVNGTLQLGRLLNPITISQSSTVNTTGKGHHDARAATGYITFYNGQSNQVTVPAGTTLTGTSGEQIVTDADANIPAEQGSIPPTLGQTTVSAHAVTPGSRGNIPIGDINQPCCTTAIRAINTTSFQGGQDERNFSTVTKTDITNAATPLKATLAQSINGALTGQLKNGEALQANPCSPTVTPDHQIGQEATTVKVTVSLTCSGIAYNTQELTNSVTQLLTSQAIKELGTGYSLLGDVQVTTNLATAQNKKVVISFNAQGLWVYALATQEQQHIKSIIAGKTKENAMQLLSMLPGIERVSMQSSGFGDESRVPKNVQYIHLVILAGI